MVGVLLSGMLDDGAAGLWEIANRRGITVIQDPDEAQFPSMPLNALQDAAVHYRLPASEIATLLPTLVHGSATLEQSQSMSPEPQYNHFSGFTCPECHGPLYENSGPGPLEFPCRVGHILSLKTLLDEHSSAQERKLYEAVLSLEEGADLALFTAARVDQEQRENLQRDADQLRRHAIAIKKLLEEREMPSLG